MLSFTQNDVRIALTLHTFTELRMLDEIQGFLSHDRAGGSEALSRMLALTLELRLADNRYQFPLEQHSGYLDARRA